MSEQWENDDEVTTTYGSIQLSLRQAYGAGAVTERKRIVDIIEATIGDYQPLSEEYDVLMDVVALITGGDDRKVTKHQDTTEPRGWVTDLGEFGTNTMIVFNPDLLTQKDWDVVNELHESQRMDFVRAVIAGDTATVEQIKLDGGLDEAS